MLQVVKMTNKATEREPRSFTCSFCAYKYQFSLKILTQKKPKFPFQSKSIQAQKPSILPKHKTLMSPFCNYHVLGLPFPVACTKTAAFSCLEFKDAKNLKTNSLSCGTVVITLFTPLVPNNPSSKWRIQTKLKPLSSVSL